MNRMAPEREIRRRVGRPRPVELEPERRPVRPSEFAPWEIASGRTTFWRSRRTWSMAVPFGPHSHL